MSTPSQPALPARVYAEAIVRSHTGVSLLDTDTPVTSDNVDRFLATADAVQAAAQQLRSAGFEIVDIGSLSITVAAPPDVYERTLSTQLEAVERPVIKELGQTTTATFITAIDDKPFGEIDVADTRFSRLLDGIAINEPIYYFAHPHPSPSPPTTDGDYLSVPEGIVDGLNAAPAHQQGITGKGVKVVMVDSGWYAHPFFGQRSYQVKVVLAPGSTDSTSDPLGHGTGESANLLAIAPDIDLTVVKADAALSGTVKNVNSISALRTAIELRPDIISCSWGSDQRRRVLSPYNRVMGAVVADAVRRGITVVFSAGNGQYGFPAQHPDVIAAGGVYRYISGSLKDTLEASNYASSFVSPMYPGRKVPDVCGLVGKLPYGSYLMLPVPPGSEIDQRLAIFKDGTERTDGWAAFSGTSAAAPQLAGVCALLKQVNPDLLPHQVKTILQQTATDVVGGFSNPSSSGAAARDGPDLATGYGLVNTKAALQSINMLMNNVPNLPATPEEEHLTSDLPITLSRNRTMTSQFPKLNKKLDFIAWQLEQSLQAIVQRYELEDIEIMIDRDSFAPRSAVTKSAYFLRSSLNRCWNDNTGSLKDISLIEESHIFAAQGLIKLGKYESTAINFLTQLLVLDVSKSVRDDIKSDDLEKKRIAESIRDKVAVLRKLASEALSECSEEINNLQAESDNYYEDEEFLVRQKIITCSGERLTCDVLGRRATNCTNGRTYVKKTSRDCWRRG